MKYFEHIFQITTDLDLQMEQVHIGHYILGKTIGAGGFAKVKEARHDLTGIKVAVKIINKKKMKNKNMISKVRREIKILKFINHPNIIKLYEVLDTTNDIFVIMELASKGQLYDFIQNNDITEEQAKFYFRQIISGIQHVHQNLISHRDLKPENILIDSNNLIKIGDFGLSNLMKDGKMLKTACGSPNYAAPEIVGQRKYEGTSVDIWSCGVILYALLVGSLPFDEETIALLYKKIEKGIYVMPQKLSPAARDLIGRMLQVDPTKRIKIYEIKNHPWLRSHIPIYYKISSSFFMEKQQQFQVDYPIYEEIKKMNFENLLEYSEEKVIKSIKKRDDQSFVIAYELLKDQKDRKQFAQENIKSMKDIQRQTIFEEVQNTIRPIQSLDEKNYVYGKFYEKPAKPLAESIVQVLKIMRIQYSIKSSDYCIKCVYHTNYKRSNKDIHNPHEMIHEQHDSKQSIQKPDQKEHRFTKKLIKFNIQIYAYQNFLQSSKNPGHLVDLQITQGHPFVFFTFVRKFYSHIDEMCR